MVCNIITMMSLSVRFNAIAYIISIIMPISDNISSLVGFSVSIRFTIGIMKKIDAMYPRNVNSSQL